MRVLPKTSALYHQADGGVLRASRESGRMSNPEPIENTEDKILTCFVPGCGNEAVNLIGDDEEKKMLQLCDKHFPWRDELWDEYATPW